ncbi:uncharacterized protein [Dysidea avara]|uniref:uncharacterized protein n=1 Tax=Dysidea avara TaxID=196820 RepID=UPI003320FC36
MADPSSIALHVFADASQKAYRAVVYIQCGNHSSLVISKSRVAPLKQHSLPRLELMAADRLTRGLTAQQFANSTLWRHGPPWLSSPAKWPTWNPTEAMLIQAVTADDPLSSAAVHNTTILSPANGIHNLIDPSAYSNYTKLLDITAYVLRFAYNTRQKLFKLTGPLTPTELSFANL